MLTLTWDCEQQIQKKEEANYDNNNADDVDDDSNEQGWAWAIAMNE